jgi:hypothetical protein
MRPGIPAKEERPLLMLPLESKPAPLIDTGAPATKKPGSRPGSAKPTKKPGFAPNDVGGED